MKQFFGSLLVASVFYCGWVGISRIDFRGEPRDAELTGLMSPYKTKFILAISDCRACSAEAFPLELIREKIGKEATLIVPSVALLEQRKFRGWLERSTEA